MLTAALQASVAAPLLSSLVVAVSVPVANRSQFLRALESLVAVEQFMISTRSAQPSALNPVSDVPLNSVAWASSLLRIATDVNQGSLFRGAQPRSAFLCSSAARRHSGRI